MSGARDSRKKYPENRLPPTRAERYLLEEPNHAHHDPGKVGARGQQEVTPMMTIHSTMTGDARAAFGMPVSGRVRVSSLRAMPLTDGVLAWGPVGATATAIADTKGDFSGFHAWSPPS